MTTYVAYSERDPKKTPVATFEVENGKIQKAAKADGSGIPSMYAQFSSAQRSRGVSLGLLQRMNRGYVITEKSAPVEKAEVDLHASGVISKADAEQQIVYGWAYVTHDKDGILKEDKSGEFVDDVFEIEKSAINFMLDHRASDLDHTNVKGGEVIESMVFTPEKREAMGIPDGILPNGWWIGVKCNDEQWAGYKAGRTSFSIHGAGTRKAVD